MKKNVENVHGFGADHLPIETNYDAIAGGRSIASYFSELVKDISVAPFNKYFDDTVIHLMTELQLPEQFTLIDLACGDGKTLERIGREFSPKPGTLMGFDVSAEMVRIAHAQRPLLTVEQGDMRSVLPHSENVADVITCINAVHYLPTREDVEKAYATAFRLVKPGGHFLLVTGDHASTAGWRNMTEEQLRAWIAEGRKPMDWSMPDKDGVPVFRLQFYPYLNSEHTEALEKAGFEQVTMYRNYPPDASIAIHNPQVYDLLKKDPIFVFFSA